MAIASHETPFGHAGACATGKNETADAKNSALSAVGVRVPGSFEDFGVILNELYVELVRAGTIGVLAEPPVPSIPVDYEWANKLGLIRKPSAFVSSIVDERGEELVYAGMKISDVIASTLGLGGTIGLIWSQHRRRNAANSNVCSCIAHRHSTVYSHTRTQTMNGCIRNCKCNLASRYDAVDNVHAGVEE